MRPTTNNNKMNEWPFTRAESTTRLIYNILFIRHCSDVYNLLVALTRVLPLLVIKQNVYIYTLYIASRYTSLWSENTMTFFRFPKMMMNRCYWNHRFPVYVSRTMYTNTIIYKIKTPVFIGALRTKKNILGHFPENILYASSTYV